MINTQQLVEESRRELAPVEQEICHHPYLAALETGRVRREDLTRFAGEQHHIIQSDLRSIALEPPRFQRSKIPASTTGSWHALASQSTL